MFGEQETLFCRTNNKDRPSDKNRSRSITLQSKRKKNEARRGTRLGTTTQTATHIKPLFCPLRRLKWEFVRKGLSDTSNTSWHCWKRKLHWPWVRTKKHEQFQLAGCDVMIQSLSWGQIKSDCDRYYVIANRVCQGANQRPRQGLWYLNAQTISLK